MNAEKDSLFNEVYKSKSDTVRFTILANFFWQYANTDLERVKYIGERAFKEIENSQNIKDLSDGYDSDVMMPGMDGFELCAILKKDERTSHIPVILLTARDGQSSLEGYRSGADDYIIKPFDNEHLKLKVKNIIATREAARNQFDFKSILSSDSLNIGKTDKEFMRKCLTVIERFIDNSDFSVEKLAEELAFSNRNFYRKIKALTNRTPAELIRMHRLNYARQLLQNSNLKIFEISMAVGYEDANKFRQAFRKQFGVSPSEIIKSMID